MTLAWGLALSCWNNISRCFLSGRTLWKRFLILFSALIHASELNVIPLCITSRRITPAQSRNTMTIMFPANWEHQEAVLFLLLSPSLFWSATYNAPVDFCSSINIAGPFMGVPHHFFHWKKELLSQHIVTTATGRLQFEELQQRCHASGSFASSYVEWGKFKCVLPEITAF